MSVKKNFLGLIFLICGLLFLVLAAVIWISRDDPVLSPITSQSVFRFISGKTAKSTTSPKIIYGFLPYWNLSKAKLQPELSHLGYFSLGIGPDGSLLTKRDGVAEPGYSRMDSDEFAEMMSQLDQQKSPILKEIVLTQFDADETSLFLGSLDAQNHLLSELDGVLLAYPFGGVNLDIEYGGQISGDIRKQLTKFVQKLRAHLDQKYPSIHLSIDLYASGSDNRLIWDLPALAPHIDHFIIMAYDFHRRSSIQAGPVAPIFGGKKYWDSDVTSHLEGFLKHIPKEKLVLGVPFYGYEWQTVSLDPLSQTFPNTGATASIARVQALLRDKDKWQAQEHWNEAALSPYVTYIEDGKNWVIYYENSRSLSYKLDLVNQLDLGGVAIWALGYEGDSRELWEVLHQKL